MKNNKSDLIYIKHILEAINTINRFIKNKTYTQFSKNEMMIDAVVRELEIIGEATNNISKEYKKKNKQVPWSKMTGIRNHLIHGYFSVNKKIVWETCQNDLAELKKQIKTLIK